jgi:hypothetical protein
MGVSPRSLIATTCTLTLPRWLFEKVYAINGCMKLSMKGGGKKRLDEDPELITGKGNFVDETHYQSLQAKMSKEKDVSARLVSRTWLMIIDRCCNVRNGLPRGQ